MFEIDTRYINGKIYKLVSNVTGDVYYGSTILSLEDRELRHKSDYKRYLQGKKNYVTSFKIIETGNFKIKLFEAYACLCRSQLEAIERIYIEGDTCINKVIPTRTTKEYHEKNKDKILDYNKEYYQKNKDKIKEYYQKNKDKLNKYIDDKRYNTLIKDTILNNINNNPCYSCFIVYINN